MADLYKILAQVAMSSLTDYVKIYEVPGAAEKSVDSGAIVTSGESISSFTQTLITSIVVCNSKLLTSYAFYLALYPDPDTFSEGPTSPDDANFLVHNHILATGFTTEVYDFGLVLSPGATLYAKCPVVSSSTTGVTVTVFGIESTL